MRLAATKPAIAAALAFGGAVAVLLYLAAGWQRADSAAGTPRQPVWVETKWPFPMDQWGEGKAFQCKAADCGAELTLFIRPKIGFCSATTGVADDNELERLSDFDFMNGASAALGDGHEVAVAWMKGRLRTYAIAGANRPRASAMSIAYNNDSDALVATVVVNDAPPDAIEPAVMAFLNGKTMLHWVTVTLGL